MSITQEFAFNVPNISDAEILAYLNQRENVTTKSTSKAMTIR
ncbi:MAG: hypothetical protein ACXAEL_07250 [Candidatus Hodarchaeales archaeon]|jgi:cation transport regulator ChaC